MSPSCARLHPLRPGGVEKEKVACLGATLIGGIAVLLWATLALFTTVAAEIPPFELVALTFAVAFLVFLAKWWLARAAGGAPIFSHLVQPWRAWLLGVAGLFGYHALYFTAFAHASAVDASLIAYLWPLLLVLFSALLPGERLGWWHVLGGLAGFAGAAVLVLQKSAGGASFNPAYASGYLAALGCAFTWAGYSVLSRRLGNVASDAVGGFCGATAILGLLVHLATETTVWPGPWGYLAVLALGLGPVGIAFFVWDYGVKRGDIQVLGAAAYASPLISTLLLVAFGRAQASAALALACLLIVGGAVLAAKDIFRRRADPA
jgi:drug/metabolite transporter (DMT)-like permease